MWADFKERAKTDGQLIEQVMTAFYNQLLKPDDCVIDGGAHAGYHTIPLSKCVPQGRVIGVEPNPVMMEKLRKVCTAPNIRFEQAALAESGDTVTFNVATDHPGRSGINTLWERIDKTVVYDAPITVAAITIDEIVRKHELKSLAFIKLDLEGGEIPALRGAQKSLRDLRPVVFTEFSYHAFEMHGTTLKGYREFLSELEYAPFSPSGQEIESGHPFWYAVLIPDERRTSTLTMLESALQTKM